MLRREVVSKMLSEKQGGAALFCRHGVRWMVGKAANRAAVHGCKLPLPNIIPVEEVEIEINRAIEERGNQRKKIENTVDSHLKDWQLLYVENIACSK